MHLTTELAHNTVLLEFLTLSIRPVGITIPARDLVIEPLPARVIMCAAHIRRTVMLEILGVHQAGSVHTVGRFVFVRVILDTTLLAHDLVRFGGAALAGVVAVLVA